MPIAQLQAETARATGIYTWATKPAANAVPVGYTITIPEFCYSDWYSDGTYWRPKGGQATLLVQDLSMFSYAVTTAGSPAGYTSPVLPWATLMAVPGFEIDTVLTVVRYAPASTQSYVVQARSPSTPQINLALAIRSSTAQLVIASGVVSYAGVNEVSNGIDRSYKNVEIGAYTAVPPHADGPVDVRLQTGGAGETMYPKILQIVYRA